MLTVRSEIGPYRRPITGVFRVVENISNSISRVEQKGWRLSQQRFSGSSDFLACVQIVYHIEDEDEFEHDYPAQEMQCHATTALLIAQATCGTKTHPCASPPLGSAMNRSSLRL